MTTGTKEPSIKDDLDADLPKIGLKRSKDPGLTKESQQNRDRHKEKRHHHRHHRHGHRHKGTPARAKTDDDVNFPKALKPLNELKNEENGKKHHSKIKKIAHDEWKKYVPPLFSVASDNDSDKKPKEESYGERQRVLYDKLNNTLNVKKHQKLYKAHHIKPKKSNLPRQQLKSSVLKSPKKQSKIKSIEQEKRKRKPNFEKRKKIIFDSTFSDPHRNTLTRLRRPSEQSESSTCTSDSFSSSFSSSSSMCKSETEPESISDSLVPPSPGLHISDDELDKINKNLTKKKGKSKKRHKSLDQRRPVVVLTPLRSHSCIEKHNQQPDKVGIFDIMEKEIADSPSSIKCETEEQDSPSIDVGKLKEKFEIFRNSLKKSRSEKRLSMSTENKSNELSKTISMPEIGAECVDGDIESDKALYNEKVKLQVQILKQRMKSGIQKKIPPIESDMKIDRHFLDVLGEENDDQGQDSELKDFASEMDESAELAENLSHIKIEPPEESNDIIDLCDYESPLPTIVRNNKVETHKTGVIKKEVIREIDFSDESPLPTIFRHYNVEAFRTNPVIPFSRIERNNSVETGKTVQIRKEVGKEIIEDFESPLPKITRSYNVEAYRTYLFKSEPDGCEENTGIIQSSQYGSHFPRIVGNYDVETLKAGQKHMEIEPESMTVSDTVCSKNSSLLMEPVGEKRDNNFREFESVEEPQQFSELNIIQMPQVVADLNLNNINLSKTNLYASSVPLHQLQLHDKNLYVSELPLVRIEISGTNAAITQSGNDMDTWSPKNHLSPVKDQPPITNFFAPVMKKTGDSKNSGQELITEIEPKIDKDTANKNNPDSDIVKNLIL